MPNYKTTTMTKKLFLLFSILFPVLAYCQDDLIVSTAYDWEQLSSSEQKKITSSAEKYLEKITKKDIKGFWELCHPKFKEIIPLIAFQETGNIIANMIPSIDSLQFIDAKKVEFDTEPKNARFSTGGSVDKSNPTYLQFQTLAGIKNQCLVLFKLNNKPLSKIITMKFGLVDSIYELTSFEINTSSIENKNADYYTEIANKWSSNKSLIPQFIALNMAYRLSYLGRGTFTTKMIDITERIQTLQKDSKLIDEIKKWTIKDTVYDIINIDFIETQSDVIPNIIYISKVVLSEKTTKEEVQVLFKYFKEKYPDLVKEFGKFIFTAYEEYPAITTKQYKLYRVIMDINEKK